MLTLLNAALTLAQAPVAPPAPSGYTRFVTKQDGTLEMSTAAVRLVAAGKPDVWLVGAIHIGSRPYYTDLQKLLDAQSAVLYEGVHANVTEKAMPKPAAGAGAPTATYKILSDAIGLDFQLVDIDYSHPNWTNVDLSMQQLDALNKAAAGGKPTQFDQVKGLLDPTGPAAKQLSTVMGMATPGMKEAIKILMIKTAGADNTPGLDPATEKIILQARNATVLDALATSIALPTPPKSVAVFYGAKHMAALQSALIAKYGYRLGERRWFPAAAADPKKLDATGKAMLDGFDKMLAPKPPVSKTTPV